MKRVLTGVVVVNVIALVLLLSRQTPANSSGGKPDLQIKQALKRLRLTPVPSPLDTSVGQSRVGATGACVD
jgi:hypothetical protein